MKHLLTSLPVFTFTFYGLSGYYMLTSIGHFLHNAPDYDISGTILFIASIACNFFGQLAEQQEIPK